MLSAGFPEKIRMQRFFRSNKGSYVYIGAVTVSSIFLFTMYSKSMGSLDKATHTLLALANGHHPLKMNKFQQVDPAPLMKLLVLTYNRYHSLTRLLESLNGAEYDGHNVSIEIHVDRSKNRKVNNETVRAARAFKFKHGPCSVLVKEKHGGVLGQWLDSWKLPADDASEIAVFLEDDLTVSPYFARWLRRVHAKYDSYPGINGYALQAESIRHGIGASRKNLEGPPGQIVFLYPVLGSWGFSPKTAAWRDLIRWYQRASQDPSFTPSVPGLKTTGWYQSLKRRGKAESMWTAWHIYHAYKNKLFTVYSNPPDHLGLSFNWKEPGAHFSAKQTVPKDIKPKLVMTWPQDNLQLPEELMVVDAKGKVTDKKLSKGGFSQQ